MIKNKRTSTYNGVSKIRTIWKYSEFQYLFQTAIPSQGGDGVVLVDDIARLCDFQWSRVTVTTVRQKAE